MKSITPMKVGQLMNRTVETCAPGDRLSSAAQIMWDRDCGCVPVVVHDDKGKRVIGMLTDRDVCMAAYTQGRPLHAIDVVSAMSKTVRSCRDTDAIPVALNVLRTNQLHRVPVVDADDHLVGLLSLADIAREAERERGRSKVQIRENDVARATEAISKPHTPRDLVCAA